MTDQTPGCGSTTDAAKRLAEAGAVAEVGDVETLAEVLASDDAEIIKMLETAGVHIPSHLRVNIVWRAAEAVLASDWLAAHDRALLDEAAERVAAAEALAGWAFTYREGYDDGLGAAALIVRDTRSTQ